MSGLYLEGADWDIDRGCLIKSKPKVLVVNLPILKVIPIEAHRLKLQVGGSHRSPLPSLPLSPSPTPAVGTHEAVLNLPWVGEPMRHDPSVESRPRQVHAHTCVYTETFAGGRFKFRSCGPGQLQERLLVSC